MNYKERPLHFKCQDTSLIGILSMPEDSGKRGILIVVGGPQYRTGSHRQFTLLARQFASDGIPTMRFDYRGMGESVPEQFRQSLRGFNATIFDWAELRLHLK